jgi:TonB-linked SusC/RagA family outer membrane protein
LTIAASGVQAQTGTITGRITDATSGQPISAAQVFVPEIDLGALSQQNGRYLLVNVPAGTHTLSVERIGYATQTREVTVGDGGTVVEDFALQEEALQLNEVIVTGTPGGALRRSLGNTVARVDAEQVTEQAVITDVEELLSARTPGLNLQRTTGNVGAGSPVRIRGVSSLELGAEPLIYVDGIRIDNDQTLGPSIGDGTGGASNALNDINPQDIASIEVVKGPAAATLYGSEASAGVIQIITKRGVSGAPEFTLQTQQGTRFMPDPEGKLGTQYYCEPFASGAPRTGACPEDLIRTFNIYAHERDYNGNELFGNGYMQSYNFSVRGGTDQVRYFISGDWGDDNGIVDWNWNNGISGRANLSVLLGDVTVDVSSGYVDGETRYASPIPGQGGVWNDMKWAYGYRLNSINTSAFEGGLRGFQEHTPENIADIHATREYNRFTGSMTISHDFRGWLTHRAIIGVDKSWDTNTRYVPLDPDGFFAENVLGEVVYGRPQVTSQSLDYGISARYQLTETIGTTTSFGAQYNSRYREEVEGTGSGFASALQASINQTAQSNLEVDYDVTDSKSLGFYVQEELNFRDRLYLTAAVRADDSSTFGSDFDLVYYPKFSAAWVVSEESFWNFDFVNSLRLRAAWGEAGRQPSAFAAQNIYESFPGPGGSAGLAPDQPGNSAIKPERSREIETGLDVAMLDDRLSAEFTYFDNVTTDAITDDPLAPSFGFPGNQDRNLGEIHNWGWELSVDSRLVDMQAVRFDLGASATMVRNKITKLGGSLESPNFQLGHPYPAVVGAVVKSAEFDSTGDLIEATAMCDSGAGEYGNLQGGPVVPCNTIPEEQLLYGPSVPPYTFTVAPTVTLFNDLQLFALAEGQYGGWFADIMVEYAHRRNNTYLSVCQCNPLFEAAENAVFDDERYFGRVEAKFWKMRDIGIRYTLPQNIVGRVGADRASLSVSAHNLFFIWNGAKTDLGGGVIADPESRGQASGQTGGTLTNTYAFPGIATISASLRVAF